MLGVVVDPGAVVGATVLAEAALGVAVNVLPLVSIAVRGNTVADASGVADGPSDAAVEAERVGLDVVWPHAARNMRTVMAIRRH
jgi:hypothetical protein